MPRARRLDSHCGCQLENGLWSAGYARVAGVDEVGRGALFGPVVAAAVVLDRGSHPGIDDSKRLAPERRHELALWIMKKTTFAVASASHLEIDALNIRQATFRAMRQALTLLDPPPDFVLVDGEPIQDLAFPQQGIIKGDQTSASIAAASILAKVQRDCLMQLYAPTFPCYNLSKNKGYGTQAHMEAIQRYGMSELHRRSFCRFLEEEQPRLAF